jgi:hypothetical protein
VAIEREIEVAEAHVRRLREAIAVGGEPGPEFFRGRRRKSGEVGEKEVHFLCEPALYYLVILVETERHSLARQDLLRDLLLDEALDLLARGRRPPLSEPHHGELAEVVGP